MKRIWSIILVAGLLSCENTREQNATIDNVDAESGVNSEEVNEVEKDKKIEFKDEIEFAKYCANQLLDGNIKELSAYTNGNILLSPYAHIDQSNVRKVSLNEIAAHTDDVHYWGDFDGSGDSILLTTPEYLNRYVLSFDLDDKKVKQSISNKVPKVRGNELHNMQKTFPNATFVEFYHPPAKEGYLDWQALIYVIEKTNNQYILKAIIHNQWTV